MNKGKRTRKYTLALLLICMMAFSAFCSINTASSMSAHFPRISGYETYRFVSDITNFGWTLAGSSASVQAENYILRKFNEFKLEDVHLEPYSFPPPMMYAEDWSLTVLSGPSPAPPEDRLVTAYPMYYKSTPDTGVTAELVYVGYGTPAEFASQNVSGKIVLVDNFRPFGPIYSQSFLGVATRAYGLGAVGVIVANVPLALGWGGNAPVTGQGFRIDRPSPLPGLQVGMHDGAYLRSLAKSGTVRVKLFLKVEPTVVTDANVVGTLPGKSDDIILIGAHLDACSWIGTVGNAGGVAVLLELAKYYAQLPLRLREKTMMFVVFGTHHVYDSPSAFAGAHPDLLPKIACFVNLDNPAGQSPGWQQIGGRLIRAIGAEARGLMVSNKNPLLISITYDSFTKYKLAPTFITPFYMGVGSASFIPAGVPTISVMTYGILAHQLYDTPEWVSPSYDYLHLSFVDELERTAKAHVDIIDQIHVTPAEDIKAANDPTNPPPVDMYPPEFLIKPLQTPAFPFATDSVIISTVCGDLTSGIKSMTLAYSTDKATWTYVPMVPSMPSYVPMPGLYRKSFDAYTGVILAHPTGTTVYYKIIATDEADNVGVDDNDGHLYEYTVGQYDPSATVSDCQPVYWAPAGPDGVRGFEDDPTPIPVALQGWKVKYNYIDANGDGKFSWNTADYLRLEFDLAYFVTRDFTPGSNQMGTFRTWDQSFDRPSIIAASDIVNSWTSILYKGKIYSEYYPNPVSPSLHVWQTWNPKGLGPTGENSGVVNYASGTFKAGMLVTYHLTLKVTDKGTWTGGFYLYDWVDWPRPIHPGYAWIDIPLPP